MYLHHCCRGGATTIKTLRRDTAKIAHTRKGNGDQSMGLKEQIVFPEINYDDVDEIRGMDVIICTTAANDDEAKALLEHFSMPFAA